MKKSLVTVIILVVLFFSLFPKSPFIPNVLAADCSIGRDLPSLIPLSVNPTSGNDKDQYTITLGWGDMTEADYNKYKNIDVRLDIINRNNPNMVIFYSPRILDSGGYTRSRINRSYIFNGIDALVGGSNPYTVDLHLVADVAGVDPKKCQLELTLTSISATSTYVENPTAENPTTGPKAGDFCDPIRQADPNFKCPTGTECRPVVGENRATYACSNKSSNFSWSNYTEPPYDTSPCAEFKDGKCITVATAIGHISTEPQKFVQNIFSIVLGLAGGIALILIIIAGYRLMASQGDPEKLVNARQQLTSAIVGLLFIIFSFVILQVIGVDILRIPGFNP